NSLELLVVNRCIDVRPLILNLETELVVLHGLQGHYIGTTVRAVLDVATDIVEDPEKHAVIDAHVGAHIVAKLVVCARGKRRPGVGSTAVGDKMIGLAFGTLVVRMLEPNDQLSFMV